MSNGEILLFMMRSLNLWGPTLLFILLNLLIIYVHKSAHTSMELNYNKVIAIYKLNSANRVEF